MTQAQLSEAVHIAPETMSRIERGRLQPSTDLVSSFASALGVKPGDLFETTGATPRVPDLRPVDRRLLFEVRELPEALVEDVIRGVRLLIEVGRNAPERTAKKS
jgi:transcriptional regulator with XRE-family HTH domain